MKTQRKRPRIKSSAGNADLSENQNQKSDEQFPGYPHYPQNEDMLSDTAPAERMDADVEEISGTPGKKQDVKERTRQVTTKDKNFNPDFVPGTSADVTAEDLQALGDKDQPMDGGEDQTLLPKVQIGPDLTGEDLDVPGAELDDEAENIGSEDEENNYYSKGQE
jgi:hypothetical protein